MENEIWKDIEGFEGKYQVSNFGNVKSLRYRNQKFAKNLTPKVTNRGYIAVMLSKNRKSKLALVHRLVAMAFVDNPNNYSIVNHKDENQQNNHVDNLEWCNHSHNRIYSMDKHPERRKELAENLVKYSPRTKKGIPHKYYKKVAILDENNEVISIYENASIAANILGLKTCNVTEVCKANKNIIVNSKQLIEKKRRTGGYIFAFLED